MGGSEERTGKGVPRIRAVPWRTNTEEKVKGALGEIPAYIRRAKRLEDAVNRLLSRAAAAREERLGFVCLRLRRLLDALEGGAALPPDAASAVERIRREVEPLPAFSRLLSRPRARRGDPGRSLSALRESVVRFNRRWARWLDEEADLASVAREVEAFNRHFPEERRAALRFVPFSKLRFEKREPPTREDLVARYPFLPESFSPP